jgi:hypothetical protein
MIGDYVSNFVAVGLCVHFSDLLQLLKKTKLTEQSGMSIGTWGEEVENEGGTWPSREIS